MAEAAENEPDKNRFKRMEAAWRALAEEQDWLDGEPPPAALVWETSTAAACKWIATARESVS
jgi:hypothetical protein